MSIDKGQPGYWGATLILGGVITVNAGGDGLQSNNDEEEDKGPDPVEAKKRFTALKRQYNKTEKVIAAKDRDSAEAQKEMDKLGELFKFFKLTPRVFDPIADTPRNILASVRDQEREIMRIAVRESGMPRKDFISSFSC